MKDTDEIQKIILNFQGRIEDGCIFFQDNIPPEQLSHFLSRFDKLEKGETPLVFIDNTSSGSAKDGALLTERRIYIKNPSQSPRVIPWKAVNSSSFIMGSPRWLIINEAKVLRMDFIERSSLSVFTEMINETIGLIPHKNPIQGENKTPVPTAEGALSRRGVGSMSPVVNRYQDAYRVGTALVGLGNTIKVVGVVLAGIIVLGSLSAGNSLFGGGAVLALTFLAAIVGGLFWVCGVIVAAQGQILQATLDNAVASSHFLTNPERADAMGLPRSVADRSGA